MRREERGVGCGVVAWCSLTRERQAERKKRGFGGFILRYREGEGSGQVLRGWYVCVCA